MEKDTKKTIKKTKVLKAKSNNFDLLSSIGFSLDPEAGLVAEIQNKTMSVRVIQHRTQFMSCVI